MRAGGSSRLIILYACTISFRFVDCLTCFSIQNKGCIMYFL